MTDWPSIHATVVKQFREAWAPLDVDAWNAFLDENVVAKQPLLPLCRTRSAWQHEVRSVIALMPDLHGDVKSWAGNDDVLFIEMTLRATLGGRPFVFTALEKLVLSREGLVIRRDSYFDPLPLTAALVSRPTSWLQWWLSGAGPFTARRRVLKNRLPRRALVDA